MTDASGAGARERGSTGAWGRGSAGEWEQIPGGGHACAHAPALPCSHASSLIAGLLMLSCVCDAARGQEMRRSILTESSVWRAYLVWRKPVILTATGLKEKKVWGGLTEGSDLPPADWRGPEFDDLAWARWREVRAASVIVPSDDGKGQGVRRYDLGQYGFVKSPHLALFCLRGKFAVLDPSGVKSLKLTVSYRGGVAAYVNGKEVGRSHLPAQSLSKGPAQGGVHAEAVADAYPPEAFYRKDGGPAWEDRCYYTNWLTEKIVGPLYPALRRLNHRIRTAEFEVPSSALRKGTNVLALEIHRAPYDEKVGPTGWSTCGLVEVELSGTGAVEPNVSRPRGLRVWTADVLDRISPYGAYTTGRVGAGFVVPLHTFPESSADPHEPMGAVRIVAARNGVFTGQVVASSDAAISGLKAEMSDLVAPPGRIPASCVKVSYMGFADHPVKDISDPALSFVDVLYESPPAVVPARKGEVGQLMTVDPGAVAPIWIRVRVPAAAPAGDYEGVLTVTARGAKAVSVPVLVRVVGWSVPDPANFFTHMGVAQSPDTLALYYKVPLWSEAHWKLMEKSYAYMSELGARVVFIPLAANTWWMANSQSMVYWVPQAGGGYKYDFTVFDRYLNLVQKHLKPDVVCLYALGGTGVTVRDPKTNALDTMKLDEPTTPEAAELWKPLMAEVMARLKKRNMDRAVTLGLLGDRLPTKEVIDTFSKILPDTPWSQLAHYGGRQGKVYGASFGYVMSVWGVTYGTTKSRYGGAGLPFPSAQHYRADRLIDLRPIAPRGGLRISAEQALRGRCVGLGPVGVDYWVLDRGAGRATRTIEGGGNVNMSNFSAAALLAPGADGPILTARFDILREAIQESEARAVVEKALADKAACARLGEARVKHCHEVLDERDRVISFLAAGESSAQREGWRWYETTGWENGTEKLFSLAAEVEAALADK